MSSKDYDSKKAGSIRMKQPFVETVPPTAGKRNPHVFEFRRVHPHFGCLGGIALFFIFVDL